MYQVVVIHYEKVCARVIGGGNGFLKAKPYTIVMQIFIFMFDLNRFDDDDDGGEGGRREKTAN
ncbi:hypothetical protein DERP_005902 [Dermatophagoides pteronyssinus]|uniref:Uncharacterized protein n=1 Tax=Dermatophagoides pteronyssinus TaxID=6956 RepID=A0ABQ8JRR1_DERPT|nr:hypothetical protein DERP_005902 [Dermatophagoides pteronyssinus]